MNTKKSFVVLAVLAAGSLSSRADINTSLSQWNVITSGDLSQVTDIGGNAYIGGNVEDQGSFTTASVGNSAIPAGTVSFAVMGNVAMGNPINVNGGSVVVGGAIEDNRIINLNGGSGATVTQNDPSGLPVSPVNQVVAASQSWSTLAANSSVSINNANGQVTFNSGAANSLSVFNINASLLSGSTYDGDAVHGFNISGTGTGDILINVNGNLNGISSSFFSSFQNLAGHILFNFYNATSVNLNEALYGYVVAPNATVTENNDIYGGVMAQTLDLSGEVNLPGGGTGGSAWEGSFLPNVVVIPEASTAIPAVGAFMVAAGFLWPRKALLAIRV